MVSVAGTWKAIDGISSRHVGEEDAESRLVCMLRLDL